MHSDNSPPSDNPPPLDPELEARIVAWSARELSAAEIAELETLAAANPAIRAFKAEMDAVQSLLTEAERTESTPLRLAPERRTQLLETLGAATSAATPDVGQNIAVLPSSHRRAPWWRSPQIYFALPAAAVACLFVLLYVPHFGLVKKPARPDPSSTLGPKEAAAEAKAVSSKEEGQYKVKRLVGLPTDAVYPNKSGAEKDVGTIDTSRLTAASSDYARQRNQPAAATASDEKIVLNGFNITRADPIAPSTQDLPPSVAVRSAPAVGRFQLSPPVTFQGAQSGFAVDLAAADAAKNEAFTATAADAFSRPTLSTSVTSSYVEAGSAAPGAPQGAPGGGRAGGGGGNRRASPAPDTLAADNPPEVAGANPFSFSGSGSLITDLAATKDTADPALRAELQKRMAERIAEARTASAARSLTPPPPSGMSIVTTGGAIDSSRLGNSASPSSATANNEVVALDAFEVREERLNGAAQGQGSVSSSSARILSVYPTRVVQDALTLAENQKASAPTTMVTSGTITLNDGKPAGPVGFNLQPFVVNSFEPLSPRGLSGPKRPTPPVTPSGTLRVASTGSDSAGKITLTNGGNDFGGATPSDGNVYVTNPNGIALGNMAPIQLGGFYGSNVSDPGTFFAANETTAEELKKAAATGSSIVKLDAFTVSPAQRQNPTPSAPVSAIGGQIEQARLNLTSEDFARARAAREAAQTAQVAANTSTTTGNEVVTLSAFSVSSERSGSANAAKARAVTPAATKAQAAPTKTSASAAKPAEPDAPRPARIPVTPPPINETATATTPVSTFSLHVSDVSFRLAAAALARGEKPDPARIRAEEFYNAFDYGDPSPSVGEKIGARIEQAAHPFLPQRNLVRVALRVASAGRGATPLHLTVLLDTSGSMEREDRAASVRRAFEVLVSLLGPNDRITLIGFARTPRLLAENIRGDQARTLLDLIKRTPSAGGTNLEEALRLGGELAQRHFATGAQNRVVLLTDGAANLGDAEPEKLAARVETFRRQGLAFDACGVGLDGLDDEILESLTRRGDGRYYALNSPADADTGFAQKLAGAFRPAAENVKVQVRFNPARVGHYRLIGFEQHRLREQDFRNDTIDAAELAADENAVALYQVELLPGGDGELGELSVRFRDPATRSMVERSWTLPHDPAAPAFARATPTLQLAGASALLAEKFRGGTGQTIDFRDLAPIAATLRGRYPQDARVQEFVTMIAQARRLFSVSP